MVSVAGRSLHGPSVVWQVVKLIMICKGLDFHIQQCCVIWQLRKYLSARDYLITDTAAFENTSLYRYQKTQANKSAQSEIRLCYLLLHYFYKTTLHYIARLSEDQS